MPDQEPEERPEPPAGNLAVELYLLESAEPDVMRRELAEFKAGTAMPGVRDQLCGKCEGLPPVARDACPHVVFRAGRIWISEKHFKQLMDELKQLRAAVPEDHEVRTHGRLVQIEEADHDAW